MVAKTKHGHGAHKRAHGSDEGTAHERLNRMHAQPGRAEGAMHAGGSSGAAAPPSPMAAPLAPNSGMAAPDMGAPGPSIDSDEGEQT